MVRASSRIAVFLPSNDAGQVGAAPLGLLGLRAHLLERGDERGVLALRQLDHRAGRDLRRHREARDLAELALEIRELRHLPASGRVVFDSALCPDCARPNRARPCADGLRG